jgi:hypothetical protein
MNIYLISQEEFRGYDVFKSAVVIADSEAQAKQINPKSTRLTKNPFMTTNDWNDPWSGWASSPDQVVVEYLGKADELYNKVMVICTSFNAG